MLVLPKRLSAVESLAFLGGGRRIVAGNETRRMFVWTLDDPTAPPTVLRNGRGERPILVPLPADDLLLCGDDELTVVNAATGAGCSLIEEGDGYRAVVGVAFHPAARRMAFVNSHQYDGMPIGSVYRYDKKYRPTFVRDLPTGTTGYLCRACAFDAAGTHLFVADDQPSDSKSGRLLRIPLRGKGPTRLWRHPPPFVEQLLVDAVNGHLAARGRDGVSIYPNGTWDWPPVRLAGLGKHKVTGLAFHPSGRVLAATSNDETVKLFDTATWTLAKTFTWKVGRMRSVAFSPDGTLAAAGSDSGQVVVWDVDL